MNVHQAYVSPIHTLLAVLLLALLTSSPGATQTGATETGATDGSTIPEFLWEPAIDDPNAFPRFVRLDRALDANGSLDAAVFEEAFISLNRYLFESDPGEPCIRAGLISIHDSPAPTWVDYQSVVDNYPNLVVAKVAAQGHGFFWGSPGTLLRLEQDQILKGDDRWDSKYLFFGAGEMNLGDRRICVSHTRYPELPEIHDRILVAHHSTAQPWLSTSGSALIVLNGNGQVSPSPWLDQKHPEWRGQPSSVLLGEIQQRALRSGASP